MRSKMISVVAMILLAIFACWPTISSAGLFKVVRVYDGDTVKAVGYDIEIKVRLVGEKHLAALVLNKIVDIKGYGSDRYGRILAEIYIDDKNINLEMVKTGYAEVYSGRPPRGLSQGDKYVSPALFRKSKM